MKTMAKIFIMMFGLIFFPFSNSRVEREMGVGTAAAQSGEEYRFLRQSSLDSLMSNDSFPLWVTNQLWLRDLVKKFFYETMKWQKADGSIYDDLNEWRIDDETELFLNWTPYYMLSGDEKIYTAIKKALFLYLARSKEKMDHGYFSSAYFDTEHTLEAMIILANLAYAKPGDAEVITALRDVVEHCGNFVNGYVPWFDTSTKHLRSLRPGTKQINESCPYGIDWPFNLQFVKMALAYYHATKDVRYLNWSRDYLDGWIGSMNRNERENGAPLLPWEVDPKTGALGSCSGTWWDDAYAPNWGWNMGSFESIRDSRGAFLDYYRLTGQRLYLESMKRMVNFCFEKSSDQIPAIWYKNGSWTHDYRSFCAAPIAISASLLDNQVDAAYESRLLGWFNTVDYPTHEQYLWRFRRNKDYGAINSVLSKTIKWVTGNVAEFEGMTSIPPDPDRFPDLEGMEGLTITAFGGLVNDRGEMPWTEVLYFHDDNSLGLEEGVAGLVEQSDETVRVVSLFNTTSSTKVVKLQADYLPKIIQSMRIDSESEVSVRALLARITLPPEKLVRVTLQVGKRDSIPPLAARNLRLSGSTESSLRIAWDAPGPAADGETAAGYVIKRDGQELARRDSLQYTDSGLSEGMSYRYEVVSLDAGGNLSQTAASATFTTLADLAPPVVTSFALVDSSHLSLVFSETVTASSAANPVNYAISPSLAVMRAVRGSDKKSITLQTAVHQDGMSYTLTVANVKDSSKAGNTMAPSTFSYTFVLPVRARNITPAGYRSKKTVQGDSVYSDRNYRFTSIPTSLLGQTRIVTANNDKGRTETAFLTFTVNKDVYVYVAYDRDLSSIPAWLQSWRKMELVVQTDDSPFICYQKYFPPGVVTLGGNAGVGSNSMYLVFLEPAADHEPPMPPTGLIAAPWN